MIHIPGMLAEVEVVLGVVGDFECFRRELDVERIDMSDVDGIVENDYAVFMEEGSSFGDDV